MRFHADSYFTIGHMHLVQGKPCQDYAFSTAHGSIALAVVSDGCSGGRHTDIGSRVVALSVASAVKEYGTRVDDFSRLANIKKIIQEKQEQSIRLTCEQLGLDLQDMLATCGYILATPFGGLVSLRGDGAIAKVKRDGTVELSLYSWNNNTPFYPAYFLDGNRGFVDYHGNNNEALKVESWKFIPGAGFTEERVDGLSVKDGIEGGVYLLTPQDLEEIQFIGIFTDGVNQIGNASDLSCFEDWKKIVTELVLFKSLAGEFVKRRTIRCLKDYQKLSKVALDDLACAVVRIEKDEDDAS